MEQEEWIAEALREAKEKAYRISATVDAERVAVIALRRALELADMAFPDEGDSDKWLDLSGQPLLLRNFRALASGVVAVKIGNPLLYEVACRAAMDAGGSARSADATAFSHCSQLAVQAACLPTPKDRSSAFATLFTWLRPSARVEALEEASNGKLKEIPTADLFAKPLRRLDLGNLKKLSGNKQEFSYWVRWLEGFYNGTPLPWDLQERVALIPEETWKAGADAVAEAIAEIEAAFLAEKAPLAEQVSYNPDTGRFFAEPIPMQNPAFMAGLMARTADALDDALHGNNGLREDMREVRVLRRTHERYGNDPQRVEMDYVSVAVSLRRNFESKELADSEDNLALLDAVEEGARGIRAHHPEVAANRESLARQALKELPAQDIALLEDAAETLPEISEGVMKEDFERDIPKLINDALTPLPNGAPPLPGMDEANRIFSRVAKTRLKIADATDAGARLFDSKAFKTVRLGMTVSALLSALVGLGLQLLGIL